MLLSDLPFSSPTVCYQHIGKSSPFNTVRVSSLFKSPQQLCISSKEKKKLHLSMTYKVFCSLSQLTLRLSLFFLLSSPQHCSFPLFYSSPDVLILSSLLQILLSLPQIPFFGQPFHLFQIPPSKRYL